MHQPKLLIQLLCVYFFVLAPVISNGQQQDFSSIEQQLKALSKTVPGLNEKTQISLSGGSLGDFLRALAQLHDLNLNIDQSLTQKVSYNFSNETVSNILLYVAKEYNLSFEIYNSIITIRPFKDPNANKAPPVKQPHINFDANTSLLTMDLANDTLSAVAKKLTQLTNRNIIVLPGVSGRIVNGYVQNIPLSNALDKLSIINQLKLSKTNDSAYIIDGLRPDEEFNIKQNQPGNSNFNIRKVNNTSPGSSSSIQYDESGGRKLISLNVVNSPIKDIIKNISEQAGINYFIYSEIAGNISATVANMEYEEALKRLLQGSAYTYSRDNGVYLIGERNFEGLRTHKLIGLQLRSVDSLLAIIPEDFKKNVTIKEFKELNSFLVNGSEPQIREIEEFVKQVDKKVPMVTIEVIIMDVNKSRTIKTGLKVGVSDSAKAGGTLLGGLDYTFGAGDINRFIDRIGLNNVFNIGRVSSKFYAQLSALESNNNVDLRQTPKLSTLNGHNATLSIGSTRYYQVTTQNVVGSLNPNTIVTQQYYPVEANLSVDIVPFVSGDENVTLTIGVNISDFIGSVPINQPPPTSASKFKSIIRVKNEDMIVLGGIERTEKSEDASGVPFLSRIPVLKWFFSSRSKTNSKVVSIVFIKPTIVYN